MGEGVTPALDLRSMKKVKKKISYYDLFGGVTDPSNESKMKWLGFRQRER